jgi:hypothetical protein
MKIQRVISNKLRCLSCNDVIESTREWELVTCKCGEVSVDGGTGDHSCRVHKPGAKWQELSETEWVDRDPASPDAVILEDERRATEVFGSPPLTETDLELIAEFRAAFPDAMSARKALIAVRREIEIALTFMSIVQWFVSPNMRLANRKPIEVWKTDRATMMNAAKLARWTSLDRESR